MVLHQHKHSTARTSTHMLGPVWYCISTNTVQLEPVPTCWDLYGTASAQTQYSSNQYPHVGTCMVLHQHKHSTARTSTHMLGPVWYCISTNTVQPEPVPTCWDLYGTASAQTQYSPNQYPHVGTCMVLHQHKHST